MSEKNAIPLYNIGILLSVNLDDFGAFICADYENVTKNAKIFHHPPFSLKNYICYIKTYENM
jgi:hypothetical protein